MGDAVNTTMVINFDTLFELLRLERSRTELQKLSESYPGDLRAFLLTELSKTDDGRQTRLKNSFKIINEIYERRERKIALLALDKSKSKSVVVDFSRFLSQEKELFMSLVDILEQQRIRFQGNLPQVSSPQQTLHSELRAVKFLAPVPRFLGPELEEYGPFRQSDTAILPPKIVDILVKKNHAEEITIQSEQIHPI